MEQNNLLKTDVVIHIGYHKTGSTFLQMNVFPNLKLNYIWLTLQPLNYINYTADFSIASFYEMLPFFSDPADITLVSNETLCGRDDGNPAIDPYRTAQRLKTIFPNARVLIVIRNQLSYILSLYLYRVASKGSETRTLNQYLTDYFERDSHFTKKLQFHRLVGHYMDLFSPQNVKVVPYELLQCKPEHFTTDVKNFIGAVQTGDIQITRINESNKKMRIIQMSRTANRLLFPPVNLLLRMHILQKKDGYFPAWVYQFKRDLVRKINRGLPTDEKEVQFDEHWNSKLEACFIESNHRLQEMTGIDLQGYGYPW